MNSTATRIGLLIQEACNSTPPRTKARNAALAKIRWTFKVADVSNDVYLSAKVQTELRPTEFLTDDITQAAVYDGRDNEEMKRVFLSHLVGEPLELVLL